ncbi:MBL fold metallo-hydrolase [Dehalococcoidia bacterium]|nr:MBL fold metallo-hydrolase [Dehalococcoidia bacterium]
MDITWLGHSCFRLKGKSATVVTDPFDKTSGYHLGKITADIVTISHDHPRHSNACGIEGNPKVLCGPGEYEIAGVFTYGIRTFHDREKGLKMGKNTIYLMAIDDIKVCHLGDLGHVLSASLVEEISDTDILLVPVGGGSIIDASAAAEVINLVAPRIVIPMHYKTSAGTAQSDCLDKFLKEMGLKEVLPLPRLTINKSALPIETEVRVLDFRPDPPGQRQRGKHEEIQHAKSSIYST